MYAEAQPTLGDLGVKLGSEQGSEILEGLKAYLRGENPFPVHVVSVPGKASWESKGDLIFITLPPSEGVTGQQWIEYFDDNDINMSDDAKTVLSSEAFQPTAPGTIHRIVALKAIFWKKDSARTTENIQAEGISRKWLEAHPEAVCIFRKCFSDKQLKKMGIFYLVGIHKPIEVCGDPRFLIADRRGDGRWFDTGCANPDNKWFVSGAFFWSLPQENQS